MLLVVLCATTRAGALEVHYNGQQLEGPTFAVYVLPETRFRLTTNRPVELAFDGAWHAQGATEFQVVAGALPGESTLRLTTIATGEQFILNTLVTHSIDGLEGGFLDGYRIGDYPARPLRNNLNYLPPAGFVRVTQENHRVRISPNFTLGQFTSKQSTGFPKYLTLQPELLLKLERIKTAVERETGQRESIVIMSGYRTPYYNRAIGNVRYSRHVYGDAADIYLDSRPRDGIMDDLDGDGRTTKADARWLYELIDGMHAADELEEFVGGLGLYGSNSVHGPFVHVDVRGYRARWGT
jgi:hypothetical protein